MSTLRHNGPALRLALLLLPIALGGCAPWVLVEGVYRADSQDFVVNLPAGWHRAATRSDHLLLTRDGVGLQYIKIEQVPVGGTLSHSNKKVAREMSLEEVTELELNEVRSDQETRNFEMVESGPSRLAGLAGFRLAYTFKAENGLRLKRLHYGALSQDGLYRMQYQAPARYYFDKDLATFEQVRESFRVRREGRQ